MINWSITLWFKNSSKTYSDMKNLFKTQQKWRLSLRMSSCTRVPGTCLTAEAFRANVEFSRFLQTWIRDQKLTCIICKQTERRQEKPLWCLLMFTSYRASAQSAGTHGRYPLNVCRPIWYSSIRSLIEYGGVLSMCPGKKKSPVSWMLMNHVVLHLHNTNTVDMTQRDGCGWSLCQVISAGSHIMDTIICLWLV